MDVEISKAPSVLEEDDAEPPGIGSSLASATHAARTTRTTTATTPAEDAQVHRRLLEGDFWRLIPAYRDVGEATFLDHHWQSQHAVTRVDKLAATIGDL